MADTEIELPEVYLQPGEVHLARKPAILRTLLGSCVGVTFWSPRLSVGALCHGVLPKCPPEALARERYRYVDFAICELVRQLENLGARRSEMQIKIFGGADVLPVLSGPITRATVGSQNWKMALEVIRREGLNLTASDLGGLVGRTIEFHTGTGEVILRRLSRMEAGDDS